MTRSTRLGNFIVEWDEVYYLAFSGGRRELPEKDQKEYNKILTLPGTLQQVELAKLGPDKNPGLIPITGMQVVELIKDARKIAFFDPNFVKTRRLLVNDLIVYESMKAKSYEMVAGKI